MARNTRRPDFNQDHLPLYARIRDELRQRILAGVYPAHARLPSESELMSAFDVSRITVRQALRDLQRDGLVFTAQGKGSFVSTPKAVQNVQRLEGFGEAMEKLGHATHARVIDIRELMPPPAVASALQLGPDDPAIEVKRVRYLDHRPVSVDVSWFPLSIGRRLLGRDLAGDIFPMLETQLGVPLGHADITMEAVVASKETATLLEMTPGDPVMRAHRLTHDRLGRPIDFEYLSFRGDAYQYRFRIDRTTESKP